jgi:tetraacyldisaccharide 4'-kinase
MADNRAVLDYLEYVVYAERLGLRDRLALVGLRMLSHIYRVGLWFYLLPLDLGLRRRKRLPVPVISIGNVTVGGTGKTPMTLSICEGLVSRGRKPAVLSYGYGGSLDGEFSVVSTPDRLVLSAQEVGDEPAMLASRLPGVPVLVGKHRYESGMHAVTEFGVDVAVLDDGFQVWKLHRDLNILLIDGIRPFDNGRMLPAGKLREPVSALRRAECIVVTGIESEDEQFADVAARLGQIAPRAKVISARHTPRALHAIEGGIEIDIDSIKAQSVFALSAIARPESFEKTLAETGAVQVGCERFPDHHTYTQEDLVRTENKARACGAEFVVTTEKDRVKIAGLKTELPFLALATRLAVSDEDSLWRVVDRVLATRPQAGRSSIR